MKKQIVISAISLLLIGTSSTLSNKDNAESVKEISSQTNEISEQSKTTDKEVSTDQNTVINQNDTSSSDEISTQSNETIQGNQNSSSNSHSQSKSIESNDSQVTDSSTEQMSSTITSSSVSTQSSIQSSPPSATKPSIENTTKPSITPSNNEQPVMSTPPIEETIPPVKEDTPVISEAPEYVFPMSRDEIYAYAESVGNTYANEYGLIRDTSMNRENAGWNTPLQLETKNGYWTEALIKQRINERWADKVMIDFERGEAWNIEVSDDNGVYKFYIFY